MKSIKIQLILKAITLFVATVLLANNLCNAQSSVHGSIVFANRTPAANASALLLHAKDTSLVKAILCSKDGAYHFNNVTEGSYIIAASFAGYQQAYSNAFNLHKNDDATVAAIVLTEQTGLLNDVTVSVKNLCWSKKLIGLSSMLLPALPLRATLRLKY